MDAQYYVRNNPFKKPEVTVASRVKQLLAVLLGVGLIVMWSMSATPVVDVRESAMEARRELQPLTAAVVLRLPV